MTEQKSKFSYKNYFKPTPRNIQYWSISLRTIVAGVAGSTILMEADKWIVLGILASGLILDELGKFAGHILEDMKEETIEIETTNTSTVKITHTIEETTQDEPK